MFKKLLLLAALVALPFLSSAQGPGLVNQWPIGQSSFSSTIAPATPTVSTVKSSSGVVTSLICFNSNSTPVYPKLYDATSVTLGTTGWSYEFMCPGNTAGAGYAIPFSFSIYFVNAIKYAVTGGIGSTDNTSITANTVLIDIGFN